MNYCVPDFETEEEYSIPTTSGLTRPKKSAMAGDEDIMELLWQNGQVVVQSQNQRSVNIRKPHVGESAQHVGEIRFEEETTPPHLFMQEDEMASWLHYPIEDSSLDRYLYNDLIYSTPSAPLSSPHPPPPATASAAHRPPIPPARRPEAEAPAKYQNFVHFSRAKSRIESAPSASNNVEPTVVESNDTLAVERPESRVSVVEVRAVEVTGGNLACRAVNRVLPEGGTSSPVRDVEVCELTVSSSPGTRSGASASAGGAEPTSRELLPPLPQPMIVDRKRKVREGDGNEGNSACSIRAEAEQDQTRLLDVASEHADGKKQARGSMSTKRSRAAEVHNLSERRRRDRINEKMKALQELIPRCNKSDKASMLDEAIEYLKSLQLQVQMMSMGCSMVPVVFPGVQQYMPPMPVGMGIGMGMGMDLGLTRPIMPYPPVLPGSALPNSAAAAAHLGPQFHVPAFHVGAIPPPNPSRLPLSDPMPSSFVSQNPNHSQLPNLFSDPYQQYLSHHQAQPIHPPQNQAVGHPNNNKPSSSKEVGNQEFYQAG